MACLGVNWAFARVFGAASNWESASITALIIALIVTPSAPGDLAATGFLVLVSAWAMASKYLVAIGKRHLFNPAAFGAALMGIGFHRTVSWWVGDNAVLLPLILLGGALILTRLRYYEMLAAFALVVLGLAIAHADLSSLARVAHALSMIAIHSMFCFFGLVMLTEPRTARWAAGGRSSMARWWGCCSRPSRMSAVIISRPRSPSCAAISLPSCPTSGASTAGPRLLPKAWRRKQGYSRGALVQMGGWT